MLISPAMRHCTLDLSRIIGELRDEGVAVFCCAHCTFPEIRREITGFLGAAADDKIHSMTLSGTGTPVYILYDARRQRISVEQAIALAAPVRHRCRGCWAKER